MKKASLVLVLGLSVFLSGCSRLMGRSDEPAEISPEAETAETTENTLPPIEVPENARDLSEIDGMEMIEKDADGDEDGETMKKLNLSASLEDVTNGQTLIGDVNTGGNATGLALAGIVNGQYQVTATFENLPDPSDDSFYEGWIVRQDGELSVISTGVATKQDNTYVNTYTSSQDYTDHVQYVLTIEPNDGDPAPAEHVLDGVLSEI